MDKYENGTWSTSTDDFKLFWYSTPYEAGTGIRIEDDLINKGGEKDMMGLYEVFVVNTKKQKVNHENVFARSEERAKLIIAKRENITDWDDEHTEFFVRCIGQWESRKPKEVKIVKEE